MRSEKETLYYILLNRIVAQIYHNQGGMRDVIPTGPLHISNVGHA